MTERFTEVRLPNGQPNWAWIEAEYRVGQLSNRAIGSAARVSEGAVRKRAKKHGWQRDLRDDVRQRVRCAQEVPTEAAQKEAQPLADEEIAEHAAARTLEILQDHRRSIKEGRELVHELITDLRAGQVERRDMRGKERAAVLDGQSRAARSLAGALKDLIALERQALGLDDRKREPERPRDFIPLAERLKRYAESGLDLEDMRVTGPAGKDDCYKVVPVNGTDLQAIGDSNGHGNR